MIGDTLSDAVISIQGYLDYDMVVEDMRAEVEEFVKRMDEFRARYDAAALGDIPEPVKS